MNHARKSAFSILELLVAIIILGVLVAIIIPRIATRTEIARLRKAQADLERIQSAEETAVIDMGYLFRLYALDDVPGGDGIGYGAVGFVYDGVQDESVNQVIANPVEMFIFPRTGIQVPTLQANTLFDNLVLNETGFGWNGPYLSYQVDSTNINVNGFPDNIPDDPWGSNYFLFTVEGLLLEFDALGNAVGQFVPTYTDINGVTHDTQVFDRSTLLSMGPNGVPGDGTTAGINGRFGRDDDISRSF